MCGAEEEPCVFIRVNFALKNKGMAVLWLQWSGIYYQFWGGVIVVSWNHIDPVISAMIWLLGSTVGQRLPSLVKTELRNRLMKMNSRQTIWDHWIISFHIQQGIPSFFYLYLVQTKCHRGSFEDCVERLEARQRTSRTSGMRMVASSTDLLYVPSQGVGIGFDTGWGFLNPAE